MNSQQNPDRQDFSIEAKGLCKAFSSGELQIKVLDGLGIGIAAGELTLISGPSGCGKSTLLSLLSALQKPDAGTIRILGQDITSLSTKALQRFRLEYTGFLFQGFNLFGALTALEQVQLPLGYLGLSDKEARERAMEALTEVAMAHRIHSRPAQLSGGEKQRVAIARALAKRPRFLFADEPTSALDGENGQNIVNILHRVAKAHGTTVLCVSHDPRLIHNADRVLAMEDGLIGKEWRPGNNVGHAPETDRQGKQHDV